MATVGEEEGMTCNVCNEKIDVGETDYTCEYCDQKVCEHCIKKLSAGDESLWVCQTCMEG